MASEKRSAGEPWGDPQEEDVTVSKSNDGRGRREWFWGWLEFRQTVKTEEPDGRRHESTTLFKVGILAVGVVSAGATYLALWLSRR